MKRSRRASAVACDVTRVGAVLPTTRSPSTKQTRIRAALEGSTPSANLPAVFARESVPATLISMAFKKPRDATSNFGILASQFHGCGHEQASAPAIGAARALDVAGKVG